MPWQRRCDAIVVVGSPTSSNTRALADTARRAGCREVARVAGPDELPSGRFDTVGVTAGASTPADAVARVVDTLRADRVEHLRTTREDDYFPLARPVRRQVGALAESGRLDPALHEAFVDDRTTSADDLLTRIEVGGLVGALAPAPELPRATTNADRRAS